MADYTELTDEVKAFNERCSSIVGNSKADSFGIDLWDFCACRKVSSPIEHIFNSAIRTLMYVNGLEREEISTPKSGGIQIAGVTVSEQIEIDNYRVDFLVTYDKYLGDGKMSQKQVIVECDSHVWHERTEQERRYEKKRDRHFAKIGLHAFHFTGAEIMREPFRVAAEVLAFLTGNSVEDTEGMITNYDY